MDSGGAFYLCNQYSQIKMTLERSSATNKNELKGIAQISSVHGLCGWGLHTGYDDQTVMVKTPVQFLAGPPLVKAATGEDVTAEELGGAKVHTSISGVADAAESDDHALLIVREIVKIWENLQRALLNYRNRQQDTKRMKFLESFEGSKKAFDIRELIARFVDDSYLFEFKPNYGKTLVTGFAKIEEYQ